MNFIRKIPQEQNEIFSKLSTKTVEKYNIFNKNSSLDNKNIKTEWEENVKNIRKIITGKKIKRDFLNNSVISQAVFMNSQGDLMNHQIDFIKNTLSDENLKNVLLESEIGVPPKAMTYEFDTSHNSIHHLYHLARYKRATKKSVSSFKTIFEWGGGYGNLCKIICGLKNSKLKTYTIVDLPEMCTLQWVYLSSIFGEDRINIVSNKNTIKENKINLVSIWDIDKLDNKYNLFISTWALSESPVIMHKFVEKNNWFGSKSLLMAIHQCGNHIPFMSESTNVGLLGKKFGARIEDIKVIPGKNYYIFK